MPKLSNGKITSSVIFYDRGVAPSQRFFAWVASQNFSAVKQIARYEKQTGRTEFSLYK